MTTTAPAGVGTTTESVAATRPGGAWRTAAQPLDRPPPARWVSNTIAVVFSLVWIFPVYWMVNTAFKPRSEAMTSTPLFVPQQPTLDNFVVAITRPTSSPTCATA